MAKTAKIAISLDATLLRRVEKVRSRTGESRSALVSRALRMLAEDSEHERRVEEYVEAYRAKPEGEAEVTMARALALRSLSALPWDAE